MTKLGFFYLHQSSTEPSKYKANVANLLSSATYLYGWKYSSIWNKTFLNIPSSPFKGYGPLFFIGMYGSASISDDPDCSYSSAGIREGSECIATEAGVAFGVLVCYGTRTCDYDYNNDYCRSGQYGLWGYMTTVISYMSTVIGYMNTVLRHTTSDYKDYVIGQLYYKGITMGRNACI